jgi:DNA-binding transcriptional ArsR family regulator
VYYWNMRKAPACGRIPARLGKAAPRDRPLIDAARAREMSALFKTMANDTRLRLLHALEREGELCVSEICARLGMLPQAVSNQLQRLADRGVVELRRDGTRLYYRIADPCIGGMLDLGFCLMEETRRTRK